MTRPLDPLPDMQIEVLRLRREAAPGRIGIDIAANDIPPECDDFYETAWECLPSLLAEVRAARAGRDATPRPRTPEAMGRWWQMLDDLQPSLDALAVEMAASGVRCTTHIVAGDYEITVGPAGRDARATPGTTDDGRTP